MPQTWALNIRLSLITSCANISLATAPKKSTDCKLSCGRISYDWALKIPTVSPFFPEDIKQ